LADDWRADDLSICNKHRQVNLKFLIAGLGSIGRRHLRNLSALGEKDIILYRTHQSTLPDDELAPFQVETNLNSALSHSPDAVIVANPTAYHLDVAIPAARAGCHILIEKPLAGQSTPEIKNLQNAVLEKDVKVLIGFQFRFHPVLAQIKALLASGQLGWPYSFRVHWGEYLPDWHPWEDYRQSYAARKILGGGVVNTLSHPMDYVRWLFGEVNALSAWTGKVSDLEIDVEDAAEITIKFESGCVGSIHLDYYQRPPAHWMEINCEKGHIRWESETGAAKVFLADQQGWTTLEPPEGFERNDLFLAEIQHFLGMIRDEAESRCTLRDGVCALKLTEAVHASNANGKWISMR